MAQVSAPLLDSTLGWMCAWIAVDIELDESQFRVTCSRADGTPATDGLPSATDAGHAHTKQRFYNAPTPPYASACCLAAASALVARGRPTISE